MDFYRVGILIRLRYRLLWSRVRARNGKIALFFVGYLVLVVVMAMGSIGGVGAGMEAIRIGRGATAGAILLAGIYLQALFASVVLGFGMTVIFSEVELRRYPLRLRERQVARHVIGIADPFWCLFLAMDLGVAAGLYLFGAGGFWPGFVAILLLFASNYLCARLLGTLVDRALRKKAGSAALILLAAGCSLLAPLLVRSHESGLRDIWGYLPPAGAAEALTHNGAGAVAGLAVVVAWLVVLGAMLTLIETRAPRVRVAQAAKIVWLDPFDRVGALFGSRYGTLIAHWLRFFCRNNRFRAVYPLALPAFAFMIWMAPRAKNPFALTVAAFLMVGCFTTGQFSVNLFGYISGGFRRFLLLPVESGAVFRAGSYAFVALGLATIPPAALIWRLLWGQQFDLDAFAMLTACSVTGIFLFNGVTIWSSLLGASRGDFYQSFGNDLSAAGNATGMGGGLAMVLAPTLLARFRPGMVSPHYWWALPPIALAALVFYFASLHFATAAFRVRREQLMVLLEGRG